MATVITPDDITDAGVSLTDQSGAISDDNNFTASAESGRVLIIVTASDDLVITLKGKNEDADGVNYPDRAISVSSGDSVAIGNIPRAQYSLAGTGPIEFTFDDSSNVSALYVLDLG